MNLKPIFLDTSFVIATINQDDQYHPQSVILAKKYMHYPLVTTDAILLELGNALAKRYKKESLQLFDFLQTSKNVTLIHVNPTRLQKGIDMYQKYQDKTWGLVDCVSFITMRELEVYDVLTFDKHFTQAGFHILTS